MKRIRRFELVTDSLLFSLTDSLYVDCLLSVTQFYADTLVFTVNYLSIVDISSSVFEIYGLSLPHSRFSANPTTMTFRSFQEKSLNLPYFDIARDFIIIFGLLDLDLVKKVTSCAIWAKAARVV